MPDMRGLTIILTEAVPERLRGALMMALTNLALGGRARLFLQFEAVDLLAPPLASPRDEAHAAAGLPTLAQLMDDALTQGVDIILCQTGLHLTGRRAQDMDPRCQFAGIASLMAEIADDRLLAL